MYGSVEPGQSALKHLSSWLLYRLLSLYIHLFHSICILMVLRCVLFFPVCLSLSSDRYVLLGNHHDAWTFGGADPNSGTAVLMELARALSDLRSKGQSPLDDSHMSVCPSLSLSPEWRPGRTLILCSWDAEEYGLIGSYEWTEVLILPPSPPFGGEHSVLFPFLFSSEGV